METIFKDIILVISEFLDDRSKLSFLSTTKINHLLKNQTKFHGPIVVGIDIWYLNSFHHFYSKKKLLKDRINKLSKCTHITLITEIEHFCQFDKWFHILSNIETIMTYLPTIKNIAVKIIIFISEELKCSGINFHYPGKILLYFILNNIKLIHEIVFVSESNNITKNYDCIIQVKSHIADHIRYDDCDNNRIEKFIGGLNKIFIKKDTIELNKSYIIQQKID